MALGGTVKTFAAAAALCAWSQAATAEVRLTGEAGGNYTVAVMSWWEIPYRSVVRQQYDFSCGSAAVATLLTYHYGRPTPEKQTFARMWEAGDQQAIRKIGFSMFDMKEYLGSVGLKAAGFRLGEDGLRQLRRPVIVLLDLNGFKHFVVVKGVRSGRVLVGDPMLGIREYAIADFMTVWNGVVLAVLPDEGEKAPAFNLAGDWGPWSTAPIEDGAAGTGPHDFTTFLPPSYQLTPQILIDVRVGTVD